MIKTKDCQECIFHSFDKNENDFPSDFFSIFGLHKTQLICAKNHKTRFYMPINMNDFGGWKKKCIDFEQKK